MPEIPDLAATQILQLISTRQLSASEALEACLARLHEQNSRINAVVTLDEEGARRRAREADAARARGELWGPLHGLPMTLKDGFSTAGMRTTAGYEPLRDYVPNEDSTVAARLKAAGAIIFGKTNVSPLLGNIQSDNPIFGRTNNPWRLDRTSGGSSGGAAAALLTGMTPLEVGSDYAGSIRIPAAFCGVYGLKTTEHRVSMWGHIPDLPGQVRRHRLLWSIGPMARSIEDLALCYGVIAGPDGRDMDVPPVGLGTTADGRPATGLRIAWAGTFPGVPVERSIREAIADLAIKLEQAGMQVGEALPPVDFKEIAQHRLVISRAVMDDTLPTMEEYITALDARDRITRAWEIFFDEWDALVCPVTMTTAFPHCSTEGTIAVDGEEVNYWRAIGHCAPFNFTGQPVVAMPVGWDSNNLPIGVQLVGRRWGEERLLAIARALAPLTGFAPRKPIIPQE
jgi:amidase